MGDIVTAVEKVILSRAERSKEFVEQIQRYNEFKERMRKAGVECGDKFSIPLMSRLGWRSK